MTNLPVEVVSYTKKFSSDKWTAELNHKRLFQQIVVIPCLDEYENVISVLDSLQENSEDVLNDTLILLVINNSENASVEIKENNHRTFLFLKDKYFYKKAVLNVAIVDAFSIDKSLDEKNAGVGLARKIGMDLSLKYFDYSNDQKKIIVCLDADCTVESNYLFEIRNQFNQKDLFAAYVNFEHRFSKDKQINKAIIAYEIFLRYYVLGLIYADSPFAFHSIGSTMVCDYSAYIKVQGMNKKKAAEDFYFLEKLAKIYSIEKIDTTTVYPAARKSYRVPFGTGQRINRFLAGTHNEYELYSPKIFEVLKSWNQIYYNKNMNQPEKILEESKNISKTLHDFLMKKDFINSYNKILRNSKSPAQLSAQKKMWFDGFSTLRLIHLLRDNEFRNEFMFDAIDTMLKMTNHIPPTQRNLLQMPTLEAQLQYLKLLRTIA